MPEPWFPPAGESPVPRTRTALAALAAAGLALLLYARTRNHAFVDIDVAPYLTQNPAVLAGLTWDGVAWAATSFHAANWHPLTWLSHMLDVELFGLDPGGHHLHSAVLHALASALVVVFLVRATGWLGPAAWCGLVFAAHPLHVESVAWIAERKDVLSGALAMGCLVAWTSWARRSSCAGWWWALFLFAAGLLAKPMLVTLPCAMLLLDAWPYRRLSAGARALLREKLPFFALAGASSVVTVLAQRAGGAVQDLDRLPLGGRLANAAVASATYVRRVVWPTDLAFYYPYPQEGHAPLLVAGSVVFLATMSALALRHRRTRPWILVGWCWLLGMLVPVIGLVQVGGQALADRYMYLPILGALVAVAWTVHGTIPAKAVRIALAAASIAALGAVATRQIRTWQDSPALAERALAVTRENHVAHNLLGYALGRAGDRENALHHLSEAVRIEPGDLEARDNLAVVLFQLGRADEAEQHLRIVLATNPSMGKAREHLGAVVLARGDAAQARSLFEEAERGGAISPAALANLADALDRLGDRAAGRAARERALAAALQARDAALAERLRRALERKARQNP
jgi:Flp pilus assembly protein TadD